MASNSLLSNYYPNSIKTIYGEQVPKGVHDVTTSQVLNEEYEYRTQINWKAHGVQHSMVIPDEGVIPVIVAMRLTAA